MIVSEITEGGATAGGDFPAVQEEYVGQESRASHNNDSKNGDAAVVLTRTMAGQRKNPNLTAVPEKDGQDRDRDRDAEMTSLLERLASTEATLRRERASREVLSIALTALQLRAASAAAAATDSSATQDHGGGSSDNGRPSSNTQRQNSGGTGGVGAVRVADAESSENFRGEAVFPQSAAGIRGRSEEAAGGQRGERPPWKNGLYKRQPYADNYVPESFLEKLVTNSYVRQPDLRLYVVNTFAVTQQISAVTLFLVVFMHTQDGLISVGTMVMVDLLLLFGGYATVFLVSPKRQAGVEEPTGSLAHELDRPSKVSDPFDRTAVRRGSGGAAVGSASGLAAVQVEELEGLSLSSVTSTLASFFLFLAILRIMAPVLRTLTVSYSDDTIYALAVTFSFLHLAFHDYSYANTASGHFQGTLSLNAAIFAVVLLASRLESNEKVFGLVLFALELFAFFPLARREVKRHSVLLHASVTSAMVLPTGLLLFVGHPTLFAAYVGTVVLVTCACPLWLLRVQRYKLRIEGPWDIAHVEAHP